jgi:hypothetical protein
MNDSKAGAILLVIGVVAMFAAIVGGGIKIQQIEVGSVQSKWRQWLLGAFGLVIGVVGLAMVLPDDKGATGDANNVAAADENTPAEEPSNAVDNAATAENGTDAKTAAVDDNAGQNADETGTSNQQ